MTRALTARKTTEPAFEWPLDAGDCAALLWCAYRAEVLARRRPWIDDPQVERACRAMGAFLAAPGWRFGVFLMGVCGNGKTTLLSAFQNATCQLMESTATRLPRPWDFGVRMVTATDLAGMSRRDWKGYEQLRGVPVLAVDDVGSEPAEVVDYGNAVSPVVDLLEHRYRRMLPTFCSTNLTPAQVSKRYGTRVADRLCEMFAVIEFDKADSYRRQALNLDKK